MSATHQRFVNDSAIGHRWSPAAHLAPLSLFSLTSRSSHRISSSTAFLSLCIYFQIYISDGCSTWIFLIRFRLHVSTSGLRQPSLINDKRSFVTLWPPVKEFTRFLMHIRRYRFIDETLLEMFHRLLGSLSFGLAKRAPFFCCCRLFLPASLSVPSVDQSSASLGRRCATATRRRRRRRRRRRLRSGRCTSWSSPVWLQAKCHNAPRSEDATHAEIESNGTTSFPEGIPPPPAVFFCCQNKNQRDPTYRRVPTFFERRIGVELDHRRHGEGEDLVVGHGRRRASASAVGHLFVGALHLQRR